MHVKGGRIVAVEPAPQAGLHHFRSVGIANVGDLMAAVEEAARRGEIAVRGGPIQPVGRRAIHDHAEHGPKGLTVVPRLWCAFDWDGVPIVSWQPEPVSPDVADDLVESWHWARPDPLLDPEIGARECLRRLPPAFRDVSCGWQVSASAGFKPGWRLRSWHWLDHPCTGAELKPWLEPAIKRNLVDPVTLVEAQPHYLAVTVRGGPDPCPKRFGMLRQAKHVVPVPDIDGIVRREQEAERRERQRAAKKISHDAKSFSGDTATAFLERCVDTLARARDGTKHRVYLEEAARVRAFLPEAQHRMGALEAPAHGHLRLDRDRGWPSCRQRNGRTSQQALSYLQAFKWRSTWRPGASARIPPGDPPEHVTEDAGLDGLDDEYANREGNSEDRQPPGDALLDLSHRPRPRHGPAMGRTLCTPCRPLGALAVLGRHRPWEPDERLVHMTRCRDYLRNRADSLVRAATEGAGA